MIRKIFAIVIFAAILTSCGNSGNNVATEEAVNVEFASLIENPDSFDGKDILITGKVVHVCEHSGKKMFIVGENPDIRLLITAGEETPKFPMELLGSEISVEGLLTRVEAPAKPEGEHNMAEMAEGTAEKAEGEVAEVAEEAEKEVAGEACETEAAVAAQPVLANFKIAYKSHIVK